ncbi:MAG: hypothetical protein INQ03_00485 [Candidatus Heimdallarchaeota archaeon]|nr:hypothetical protein [Candidatus Heimdallarchaeota archaeon]
MSKLQLRQIGTNMICSLDPVFKQVDVSHIVFEQEISFSKRQSISRRYNQEHKTKGRWAISTNSGIMIAYLADIPHWMLKYAARVESHQVLKSENLADRRLLKRLADVIINTVFRSKLMGYTHAEQNKFYKKEFDMKSGYKIHQAVSTVCRITSEGFLLLTIDPSTRWTAILQDWAKSNNHTLDDMIGKKVKVPNTVSNSWSSATLQKIVPGLSTYRMTNGDRLLDFWESSRAKYFLEQWNLQITGDLVAEVKFKKSTEVISYPMSCVRLSIDMYDSSKKPVSQKVDFQKRVKETLSIAKNISMFIIPLGETIISLGNELLDGEALLRLGYKTGSLPLPRLRFANNGVIQAKPGMFSIKSGLTKFGPVSGPKEITIHFVCPADISSEKVKDVMNKIKGKAAYFKLGDFKVGRIIQDTSTQETLNEFRKEIYLSQQRHIVFVMETENMSYYKLKKIFENTNNIPTKGISRSTFYKLARNDRSASAIYEYMSLISYARTMIKGEAMILFEDSLPGLENYNPLFLAMDISFDPVKQESASADIVAMTSEGYLIPGGEKTKFLEGLFVAEHIAEWLYNKLVQNIVTMRSLFEDTPNLILYIHDGAMTENQVIAFEEGIAIAQERLGKEYPMEYIVIEVTKRVPERLYQNFGSNAEIGTYMKSSSRGWLVASNPQSWLGASALLRIRIRADSTGSLSLIKAIHIMHNLRFLNPVSPFNRQKEPIIQQFAHKKSNLYRKGLDPDYLPF